MFGELCNNEFADTDSHCWQ